MVTSLEINSLALSNCFRYRNVFQNGVNALSKKVLKRQFFVKSSKFRVVLTIQACVPNTYQIMYGETLDFQFQH